MPGLLATDSISCESIATLDNLLTLTQRSWLRELGWDKTVLTAAFDNSLIAELINLTIQAADAPLSESGLIWISDIVKPDACSIGTVSLRQILLEGVRLDILLDHSTINFNSVSTLDISTVDELLSISWCLREMLSGNFINIDYLRPVIQFIAYLHGVVPLYDWEFDTTVAISDLEYSFEELFDIYKRELLYDLNRLIAMKPEWVPVDLDVDSLLDVATSCSNTPAVCDEFPTSSDLVLTPHPYFYFLRLVLNLTASGIIYPQTCLEDELLVYYNCFTAPGALPYTSKDFVYFFHLYRSSANILNFFILTAAYLHAGLSHSISAWSYDPSIAYHVYFFLFLQAVIQITWDFIIYHVVDNFIISSEFAFSDILTTANFSPREFVRPRYRLFPQLLEIMLKTELSCEEWITYFSIFFIRANCAGFRDNFFFIDGAIEYLLFNPNAILESFSSSSVKALGVILSFFKLVPTKLTFTSISFSQILLFNSFIFSLMLMLLYQNMRIKFFFFLMQIMLSCIWGFFFNFDGILFLLVITELTLIIVFILLAQRVNIPQSINTTSVTLFCIILLLFNSYFFGYLITVSLPASSIKFFKFIVQYIVPSDFFIFYIVLYGYIPLMVYLIAAVLGLFSIFFIFVFFIERSHFLSKNSENTSLFFIKKQQLNRQPRGKSSVFFFNKKNK